MLVGAVERAACLFISSRVMAHLSYSLNHLSLLRVRVFAGHFSITLFPCFLPLCPLLPPRFIVHSTFKPRFLDLAPLGPSLFLKCCHSLAPSGAAEQLRSFGPTKTASYRYEPVYLSPCVAALPFSSGWPRNAPHRAGSCVGAHGIVR